LIQSALTEYETGDVAVVVVVLVAHDEAQVPAAEPTPPRDRPMNRLGVSNTDRFVTKLWHGLNVRLCRFTQPMAMQNSRRNFSLFRDNLLVCFYWQCVSCVPARHVLLVREEREEEIQ
jgi:hypothetical protein